MVIDVVTKSVRDQFLIKAHDILTFGLLCFIDKIEPYVWLQYWDQGWEFILLLFALSLKIALRNRERFSLVTLKKSDR